MNYWRCSTFALLELLRRTAHRWSVAPALHLLTETNQTFIKQIVKIREIAATLLDYDDVEATSDLEQQSRQYVAQFANILADLDYMGQAAIIPPVFAAY